MFVQRAHSRAGDQLPVMHRLGSGCSLALFATVLTPVPAATAASPPAVPLSPCVSADHGRPVVDKVTLGAGKVDVRRGARTVTVRARLHDTGGPGDPTGLGRVTAAIGLPNLPTAPGNAMHHIEGDLWQGQVRIPRRARPGSWPVDVTAADAAGNISDGQARLTVRSFRDHRPPSVTGFRLSRTTVDATTARRGVSVTVDARDKVSGVRRITLSFEQRAGASLGSTSEVVLHRVAGSARSGRWRGRVVIPAWGPAGLWDPSLTLVDAAGHLAFDSTRPGPASARNTGPRPIRVRSAVDRSAPTVSLLTAPPTSLDVRTPGAAITFDVRVHEPTSRVRGGEVALEFGGFPEQFVPLRLVEGTTRDGVWRGRWTPPGCRTIAGTWVAHVDVEDIAGNDGIVKPLPRIEVANDDVRSPRAAGTMPGPTQLSLTFDEDVVGISAVSAAVTRTPTPKTRETSRSFTGSWQCRDAAGATVDCVAGPLRVALFTPDVAFPAGLYSVSFDPEHVLAVTDLAGNPYFGPATALLPGPT